MRQVISKEEFEAAEQTKLTKDNIEDGRIYLLYLDTGKNYWKVEVEVWYDSTVGSALLEIEHRNEDMIFTDKKRYGKTWFLT